MTRLLAFDTSTQALSIALVLPTEVLVHEGEGGAKASTDLIAAAQALLAQAGLRWGGLDAIAFGRGPGAFTGLRTACSVAQGLALGADLPVLPLDSLMLVAQDALLGEPADAAGHPQSVWVAIDARMGEVYAAQYGWQPATGPAQGHWDTLTAPLLTRPGALAGTWRATAAPRFAAGNALALFEELSAMAAAAPRWRPQARISAAALAALAGQAWARGGAVDPALALPLYVRDKVAETTAERDAARSATPTAPKNPDRAG